MVILGITGGSCRLEDITQGLSARYITTYFNSAAGIHEPAVLYINVQLSLSLDFKESMTSYKF